MTLRFVALGDSYTIGTAVEESQRWPDQLVDRLGGDPPALELVANLAVNGYTSADVIREELPALPALRPDLVSLLVGVNDVVQGVPAEAFAANVRQILDSLIGQVGVDRIVVVTTPDYTVTPRGSDYGDPLRQGAAVRANNASLTALAAAAGVVAIVDIHEASRLALDDRSLVADDGLHPSGLQYARWVDLIVPVVERMV